MYNIDTQTTYISDTLQVIRIWRAVLYRVQIFNDQAFRIKISPAKSVPVLQQVSRLPNLCKIDNSSIDQNYVCFLPTDMFLYQLSKQDFTYRHLKQESIDWHLRYLVELSIHKVVHSAN